MVLCGKNGERISGNASSESDRHVFIIKDFHTYNVKYQFLAELNDKHPASDQVLVAFF